MATTDTESEWRRRLAPGDLVFTTWHGRLDDDRAVVTLVYDDVVEVRTTEGLHEDTTRRAARSSGQVVDDWGPTPNSRIVEPTKARQDELESRRIVRRLASIKWHEFSIDSLRTIEHALDGETR